MRPARAIPYTLHAHGRATNGVFRIDFRSDGQAGAVFQVRSAGSADAPRSYTVAAGTRLSDTWNGTAAGSDYDLSVYGPNGFFREFKGGLSGHDAHGVDVQVEYDEHHNDVVLQVSNPGGHAAAARVFDSYRSKTTALVIEPGDSESKRWSLERTGGWYDLTVTIDGNARFRVRLAGHVENGEDSVSDPLMGGLV